VTRQGQAETRSPPPEAGAEPGRRAYRRRVLDSRNVSRARLGMAPTESRECREQWVYTTGPVCTKRLSAEPSKATRHETSATAGDQRRGEESPAGSPPGRPAHAAPTAAPIMKAPGQRSAPRADRRTLADWKATSRPPRRPFGRPRGEGGGNRSCRDETNNAPSRTSNAHRGAGRQKPEHELGDPDPQVRVVADG